MAVNQFTPRIMMPHFAIRISRIGRAMTHASSAWRLKSRQRTGKSAFAD
jgi:hypothetical protein